MNYPQAALKIGILSEFERWEPEYEDIFERKVWLA
jgi:hypothetical protein